MSRKSKPVIIESVFYNYTGTDEQFNTFLKSVIKWTIVNKVDRKNRKIK